MLPMMSFFRRLNWRRTRFAALKYSNTRNLGDEIQTIAAQRFLPHVDAWVDRERLSEFSATKPHKIILNGWFLHRPDHWPPAECLDPLIISFHIATTRDPHLNPGMILPERAVLEDANGKAYLKRHEPIGARDLATLSKLQAAGVDAYFSGCLTLTLQPPRIEGNRHGVYTVDVPEEVITHLEKIYGGPILRLTHYDKRTDSALKFQRAAELLRIYATAKAVVTCNLHCALPCLPLNTPVLFIENSPDPDRFAGLRNLMRHASVNDVLQDRFDFDLSLPSANGTEWCALRDDLVRRCQDFVWGRRSAPTERQLT